MKALYVLICLGAIEHSVFGDDDLQDIQERAFPKKVDSVFHKKLKLLNRRYFKKLSVNEEGLPLNTKKQGANPDYTAFPPNMDKMKTLGIPESPYFPADMSEAKDQETKTRVKKVLGSHLLPLVRKQRSPEKESDAKVPPIPNKHPRAKRSPAKSDAAKAKPVKATDKVSKKTDKKAPKPAKAPKALKAPKNAVKPKKGKEDPKKKPSRRQLQQANRRLIGARDASIEDYPYTVSIQKDGEHWCGGAILNQRLIITTANCMWKANRMSRLKVRAGSRSSNNGGQVISVAEVMKHPGWSIRKNPNYDLALVLLEKNLKFSHSVHAVDLPNRVMLPVFEDAWVTSWGSERRDGIFEKRDMTLQVFHTRLMDRQKCTNITQRFGVAVTENFICLTQDGKRAPCTRDTGAPAVSDGVIWGVASWGIRKLCGTERFPAMFSYIASQANMDFISNATTYLMSEPRESPFLGRYEVPHMQVRELKEEVKPIVA